MDGTLLHIAERPDDVVARPDILELLASLHRLNGGALALVSGRSLEALDAIFEPLAIAAAGQHGHERRDGMGNVHRAEHDERGLAMARAGLARFVAEHPGTHVEDKGASVALHYRGAAETAPEVRAFSHQLAKELPETLRLQPGKMVLEIKPRGVSKDTAIAEFMSEPPFEGRRPVFVGDDLTDEDGFRFVNARGGVSIKVGAGDTEARYRLEGVDAVVAWLRDYRDFLREKREKHA